MKFNELLREQTEFIPRTETVADKLARQFVEIATRKHGKSDTYAVEALASKLAKQHHTMVVQAIKRELKFVGIKHVGEDGVDEVV